MVARSLAAAAALAALAPLAARPESALSCPGGLVAMGDSKVDLLAKCGKPALEERQDGVARIEAGRGEARVTSAPVERWTFDLGRSRFVQVVTLVGGKVTAVERGGHGQAEAPAAAERPRRATCDPSALSPGKLKLELLSRCGEPAMVDRWEEELRTVERPAPQAATVRAAMVTVELWTYDFGPRQFLRFVRLEGGKVTAVETGSYGYAR